MPKAEDVDVWLIDAGGSMEWRSLNYPGQPDWLAIRLKFAPTADGVAVIAAQIERVDGHALTARDLRLIRLPPGWTLSGQTAMRWYAPSGETAPVTPSRKGVHHKDDTHWHAVWEAWVRAKKAAPRAPVKVMLRSGQWHVTDATMRRWIARARQRAAVLGWDRDEASRKGTEFPRHGDSSPAAQSSPGSPDSPGISAIDDKRS